MKILFVCTGNTCRSCMAEAIFNSNCCEGHRAFSAGIAVIPNSKTSYNAADVLKRDIDVNFKDRFAVQLTSQKLEEADYVFTMTGKIRDYIKKSYPEYSAKVYTINEFVGVKGDIIDPYGGDISIYEKTYNELKNRISLLLDKLKEDISIWDTRIFFL